MPDKTLTEVFTDIADAIREKTGSEGKMTPLNMAEEIDNIPTGPTEDGVYVKDPNQWSGELSKLDEGAYVIFGDNFTPADVDFPEQEYTSDYVDARISGTYYIDNGIYSGKEGLKRLETGYYYIWQQAVGGSELAPEHVDTDNTLNYFWEDGDGVHRLGTELSNAGDYFVVNIDKEYGTMNIIPMEFDYNRNGYVYDGGVFSPITGAYDGMGDRYLQEQQYYYNGSNGIFVVPDGAYVIRSGDTVGAVLDTTDDGLYYFKQYSENDQYLGDSGIFYVDDNGPKALSVDESSIYRYNGNGEFESVDYPDHSGVYEYDAETGEFDTPFQVQYAYEYLSDGTFRESYIQLDEHVAMTYSTSSGINKMADGIYEVNDVGYFSSINNGIYQIHDGDLLESFDNEAYGWYFYSSYSNLSRKIDGDHINGLYYLNASTGCTPYDLTYGSAYRYTDVLGGNPKFVPVEVPEFEEHKAYFKDDVDELRTIALPDEFTPESYYKLVRYGEDYELTHDTNVYLCDGYDGEGYYYCNASINMEMEPYDYHSSGYNGYGLYYCEDSDNSLHCYSVAPGLLFYQDGQGYDNLISYDTINGLEVGESSSATYSYYDSGDKEFEIIIRRVS